MKKALILFFVSGVAAAQEAGYNLPSYVGDAGLYQRFIDAAPNWLVGLVPILLAILVGARALSEILLMFAKKTENKTDDKIVSYLGKGVNVIAKLLGQIGVGMPKKMVEEKAKKIEEKKSASEK